MRRLEADPYTAILLHWTLPEHDALKFLCRLHEEVPRTRRPPVLAFIDSWTSADLRRALQLGVDAVLTTPLRPEAVAEEIEAITTTGESASIRQLLLHAAEVLLRHDPELWAIGLPAEWAEVLLALAEVLRAHRAGGPGFPPTILTVMEALAPELPDDVDAARLRVMLGGAMRAAFKVDTERLKLLLPAKLVIEPLTDEAKVRLRALRSQVEIAVDHVELLQLKKSFGSLLEQCPEVDYDGLRNLLPDLPPELAKLPAKVLDRLRALACLLSQARHPERVVATWIKTEKPSEAQTEVVNRLLVALEAEEARQALWSALAGPAVTIEEVREHLEEGRLRKALRAARALPETESEKAALLNNVGLALRGAKEYDLAESAYLDALCLRAESASLLFNLAVVKHDRHAYEEALSLVARVLERSPNMERAQRLRTELQSVISHS